jgi:hypothetical protein
MLFISSFTDVINEKNEGSSDIASSRLRSYCHVAMRVPLTFKREEGAENTDVMSTRGCDNRKENENSRNSEYPASSTDRKENCPQTACLSIADESIRNNLGSYAGGVTNVSKVSSGASTNVAPHAIAPIINQQFKSINALEIVARSSSSPTVCDGASSNPIERNDKKDIYNVRNNTEDTDATNFQSTEDYRFNTALVGAVSDRRIAGLVHPVDSWEEVIESTENSNSKLLCDITSDAVTSHGRSRLLSQKNKIQLYEWLAAYRDGKSRGEGNGRGKKSIRGASNQEHCRAYLTDEVIETIIQIVPMNRDDLVKITQCAVTQDLLLESLSSFFKEYDLLHLFPTLAAHRKGASLLTVPPPEAEMVARKSRSSDVLGSTAPAAYCGTSSSLSTGENSSSSAGSGDRPVPHSASSSTKGLTRSHTSVTAASSKRPAVNVFISAAKGLSENTAKRRKLADETQNRVNVHINLREPYRPTIPMHVKGSAFEGSSSASTSSAAGASSILSSAPHTSAPGTSEMSNQLRRSSTAALAPKGGVLAAKDPIQRRRSMSAVQTMNRAGMRTGTVTDREKGAGSEIGTGTGRREVKCVEVVRKKTEREALPGHQCTECAAYYAALLQQGMVTETGMEEMLLKCSRHKVLAVQSLYSEKDDICCTLSWPPSWVHEDMLSLDVRKPYKDSPQ